MSPAEAMAGAQSVSGFWEELVGYGHLHGKNRGKYRKVSGMGPLQGLTTEPRFPEPWTVLEEAGISLAFVR